MLNNKWKALTQFQLGGVQADLFLQKLQQQNGWDKGFCLQAIEEYKRFVYLMSVSNTPITPSVIVDEVWHLHLTFSRNYWDDMCKDLLGCNLHHDPATASEEVTMQNQYDLTLEVYHDTFNESPPKTHWPHVETKQTGRTIVKPALVLAKLAIACSLLFTTTAWASSSGMSMGGYILLFLIAAIVASTVVLALATSTNAYKKGNGRNKHNGYSACGANNDGSTKTDSSNCNDGGSGGWGGCGGGGCGGGGCGGGS